MPKAKTSDLHLALALALGLGLACTAVQAQTTLGEMIDKTKLSKQRELQSPGATAHADAPPPPPPPPELWAIEGLNGKLVAQIWQGDTMHRLPIAPGAQLPSQWRVVSGDAQQLVMAKGRQTVTLRPKAAGSTGWEFAQVPRSAGSFNASNTMTGSARAAAGNLPSAPLPPAAMPPSTNSPPR